MRFIAACLVAVDVLILLLAMAAILSVAW